MPTFYNFTKDGLVYSFDDIFVPADFFKQGNLFTWGNGSTLLGNDATTNRTTPVTTFAGGTNWKSVSAGTLHFAAVKSDGTLWTWGLGSTGRLGNNDITDRSTPVTTFAGGNTWRSVSCGYRHTAAVKTDGTLWVWGNNNLGQLGDNSTTDRSTPVTTFAGGTNWRSVSCGYRHTLATKTDGTLWTWGNNSAGQVGNNAVGATLLTPITTFAGGTNWSFIGSNGVSNSSAAIKTDGTLWTWGNNGNGQVGDNTTTQRNTPVTTFSGGTNWKSVVSGFFNTAAIKTDGTLWVWGLNDSAQLGINAATAATTPVTTFAGGANWKSVSIQGGHCLAVKTDGTLWVWGSGGTAKLGNNATTNRSTPVTTFAGGTNWKSISAGNTNSIASTYIDYLL